MRPLQSDVHSVLAADGVISVRDHPELATTIDWLVRSGRLARVLPGVYAPADAAASGLTRIAAVPRWDPNAVLTHDAAAMLTFWPKRRVGSVRCAVASRRSSRAGFEFSRAVVPPELVWEQGRIRFSAPALTALDLATSTDGESIDRALHTRATNLALLHLAYELTHHRRSGVDRRKLLLDSRDDPWSAAERDFHKILRKARITGWKGNQRLVVGQRTIYVDVLFRRLRIAIEIDGRQFHEGEEVFETDRERQNLLILDGWTVLRFTWRMIHDDPEGVLRQVREAVAQAKARH